VGSRAAALLPREQPRRARRRSGNRQHGGGHGDCRGAKRFPASARATACSATARCARSTVGRGARLAAGRTVGRWTPSVRTGARRPGGGADGERARRDTRRGLYRLGGHRPAGGAGWCARGRNAAGVPWIRRPAARARAGARRRRQPRNRATRHRACHQLGRESRVSTWRWKTSGNAGAAAGRDPLHPGSRATVVHVPWGPKDASALRLDEEFHLTARRWSASQAVWNTPTRSHPSGRRPRPGSRYRNSCAAG